MTGSLGRDLPGRQVAVGGVEGVDEMVEGDVQGLGEAEAPAASSETRPWQTVRHMRIAWIMSEPSRPYPLRVAAATATAWSLAWVYSSSPGVGACTLAA